LKPVSGRANGGVQCNGMEPFERVGVRHFHPQAKAAIS
jgi:hypothetical protein